MRGQSLLAPVAFGAVAVLLCGCGGTPPPGVARSAVVVPSGPVRAPSDERERSSAAPPLEWLALGELRVNLHGKPWLVLYRNGLLADRDTPLGTLLPDGRFVDLDGVAQVTVKPDGTIAIDGGWIAVAEDGSMRMELHGFKEEGLTLDKLGALRGIEIVGLRPELRRTAALMVLIPDLLRSAEKKLVE